MFSAAASLKAAPEYSDVKKIGLCGRRLIEWTDHVFTEQKQRPYQRLAQTTFIAADSHRKRRFDLNIGSAPWLLSGARIGSRLQCGKDTLGDFFHPADTPNAQEFWCLLIAARRPVSVILYQWLRLTVIELEAPFHGIFPVVLTLDQLLAGHIILPVDPGSIELNMISAPGWQVGAATRQAIDDYIVSYGNLHHVIQVYISIS